MKPLILFRLALLFAPVLGHAASTPPLPVRLADTGLYAPGSATEIRAGVLSFAPQYPLWSDGTRKRRWIALPPGTAIDARHADAWEFPVGTRLWKEFGYGRRIETRMIERLSDGSWRFAAYVWNADGTEATLAPEDGAILERADAPGGRYAVPARNDCTACHEGAAVPVLGFSALQLSPDRDPLSPHADTPRAGATDLRSLAARGWLNNLSPELLATPPRIRAATPIERAALGYLHGNCGHCHNAAGALTGLELLLAQQVEAGARSPEQTVASLLGHASRFRPHGSATTQRVATRATGESIVTLRMKSTNPLDRMPPLGVQVVDQEGVALIERWISTQLQTR
jgi:mono/diheme cytochrome c family protein